MCAMSVACTLTLVRDECATSYHLYLTFATSWIKYDASEVYKNIRLSTFGHLFYGSMNTEVVASRNRQNG